MYGLHATLYVYDTICMQRTQRIQRNATDVYVAICMQRTQRMQRNATDVYVAICMQRTQRMQRSATDAYVAICPKACYGFNAIALTQHLRRCDTSLARVVVITERSTRALQQRYAYAIHALTASCGYQTQPTFGGLLQLVPCVAHAWFSQLAGTFPKPQTRLPA